ncbi:MAG: CvpA family protein [Polaromonas sp.]|nr:CvpA family protein [Polaromonas sp.]
MTYLDWILIAVLGISFVIGAWRGLVFEVLSVFVWIAAFLTAQWFAPDVAAKLPLTDVAPTLRHLIAFVLIFVAVAFVAGLINSLIKKLISAVGLRPVDRSLGAIFGLFRGVILLLALTVVVHMTQFRTHPDWQASTGAGILTITLQKLKPLLPQQFGAYLP